MLRALPQRNTYECHIVLILTYLITILTGSCNALKILQIVPGFTNSHVLFNYRLAETLTGMGHKVHLWTQMEMSMVFVGDVQLPASLTETRVSIHFTDTLKTDGLKVFQTMMFNAGSAYDLWWTGQEFKSMRVDACAQMLRIEENTLNELRKANFDLAIAHFHDLCPLALAKKVGVRKLIWITHGTSVYDFTAVQMGLRLFPAFVPHPLSSNSDRMHIGKRLFNFLWHLSTLDFVNLPQNLLHEENEMYKTQFTKSGDKDLWQLSESVNVLLVNGERFLDFPRPLPLGIAFMGEIGKEKVKSNSKNIEAKQESLPANLEKIYNDENSSGVVIFSLGTVSNTTNMPEHMINSFVAAFARFSKIHFIWKTEITVAKVDKYSNIHIFRWIPQKALMKHPRTKLLIAHGGYNSFLEASQAGVPIILMPLFADQFINVQRAQRFKTAQTLDKLTLTADQISKEIQQVLDNTIYRKNALRLAKMLADKPPVSELINEVSTEVSKQQIALSYAIKLASLERPIFALKSAQKLSFLQFYSLDSIFVIFSFVLITIFVII